MPCPQLSGYLGAFLKEQILVYDGLQHCPYRPGQVARMPLYRQLKPLTPQQADERFARSERRIGTGLYYTQCPTCSACQGVRIPVADFRPSRSQRRVLGRWKDRYRIEMGDPTWSNDKIEMFNRHKSERNLKQENDEDMTALGYFGWLINSCIPTVEMRYFVDEQLVGVGLVDIGAKAASSVYFYFEPTPEISRLSPGVFSTLQEIEFCRKTKRDWLYLGLYVEDCSRLNYKGNYFPHERSIDSQWKRFTS